VKNALWLFYFEKALENAKKCDIMIKKEKLLIKHNINHQRRN
jgi:hypothetical protein